MRNDAKKYFKYFAISFGVLMALALCAMGPGHNLEQYTLTATGLFILAGVLTPYVEMIAESIKQFYDSLTFESNDDF